MKKLIATLVARLVLMFCEYRFIMVNLTPYTDNGYLCIEFMGNVDCYHVEEREMK